jgi:hypothetical protein
MYLRSQSAASVAAWNTECSYGRDHMKIKRRNAVHVKRATNSGQFSVALHPNLALSSLRIQLRATGNYLWK